jgi:sulfatase maturation enzyme AslB (radical SAM superfamily)
MEHQVIDANKIFGIEIEASTHCNWRCVYCPVSQDPKPPRSMDPVLFRHILDKAVAHRPMRGISINAYCEPTIDVGFMQRLDMIANTRLKLTLYTNGTGLTLEHIQFLRDTHILNEICFNLPSLDPHVHAKMTQSPFYAKSIAAIEKCLEYSLPVSLSVQGDDAEIKANFPGIFEAYGQRVGFSPAHKMESLQSYSSDRCGILKHERYYRGTNLQFPLIPCPVPETWLYVNVDGDLFICCEDYYQVTKYANIRDGSIAELIALPARAAHLPENCGPDAICRRCGLMNKLINRQRSLNVIPS